MKHFFTTLFTLFAFSSFIFAQVEGPYDASFGSGGVIELSGIGDALTVNAVDIQSDGKVVLAGYNLVDNQKDYMVLRLNEDGSLDPTFGQGGISTSDVFMSGYEELLNSVRVMPDGKIMAGGIRNFDGVMDFDAFSVRLNADGTLDDSYGFAGGGVSYDGSFNSDYMHSSYITSDGSVAFGGDYSDGTNEYPTIWRFNSNGNTQASGNYDLGDDITRSFRAVIMDDATNIYAAGINNGEMLIAKFDPSGQLVPAFNGDGIVTIPGAPGTASCMTFADDGNLLVCGEVNGDILVGKFAFDTGDGILAFGTNQLVQVDVWGGMDTPNDIKVYPDGRILIVASSEYAGDDSDLSLVRLNSDGTLDTSFGDNGVVFYHKENELGEAIAISSDEKIVATGNVTGTIEGIFAVRYLGAEPSAIGALEPAATGIYLSPNPVATTEVNLFYTLATDAQVQIDLYELNGRNLSTLLKADRLSGEQQETLALPDNLANGSYLVRIETEAGVSVQRLAVIR